jgi:serine protease Do
VRIQKVDEGIAESLGLGKPRGALISGVEDKGPSASAGFKPGDVIVSFDGKTVPDAHELPKIVAQSPVGKEVEIVVLREGKELARKVTLGQLDETAKGKKVAEAKPQPGAPVAATTKALGLELAPLDDAARGKFQIKEGVKAGALIVKVDPDTPASEQKLTPGEVITEINRAPVTGPEDVETQVKALKAEKKKTALLLVANGQGQARFVALTLE